MSSRAYSPCIGVAPSNAPLREKNVAGFSPSFIIDLSPTVPVKYIATVGDILYLLYNLSRRRRINRRYYNNMYNIAITLRV